MRALLALLVLARPALADQAKRDDTLTAAEADLPPADDKSTWNEYDGRWFTFRGGAGFLVDYATYDQSEDSELQMQLDPDGEVRDLRFFGNGKLENTPLSYTFGYMYDGVDRQWRWRQTGLMYAIAPLSGQLFVGRTKEGFSTSKIMVGYNGWLMERSAANDALLPILNDGVKWTGQLFRNRVVYNLGVYNDLVSEDEPFSRNDFVLVGRVVWLPLEGTRSDELLHLVAQVRWADADDGMMQFRSKPESFAAQDQAVDTGAFAADYNTTLGVEAYYRSGPFVLGSEYYFSKVRSASTDNPFFQGGDLFVAYALTGEVREYNRKGGFFEMFVPSRSVNRGKWGGVEVVLRVSYVDLDSRLVEGGTFTRITPLVSWHMSRNMRLELAYGYSWLERMGLQGETQYFQTRLQLQIN